MERQKVGAKKRIILSNGFHYSGKIISSDADLRNLVSMCADGIQVTFVELAESCRAAWLYFKIREICQWKSCRDRTYDLYIEKIGKMVFISNR